MGLQDQLDNLEKLLIDPSFRDAGKEFEAGLKQATDLTREDRQDLWNRYQELWTQRKEQLNSLAEESARARKSYFDEIEKIDFGSDFSLLATKFDQWERVGEKIRAAREIMKSIQARIKEDRHLKSRDRHEIYELIDRTWSDVAQKEEIVFSVHGERADQLIADAERAAESLRPGEASGVLKGVGAEFRTLWLRADHRARCKGLLDGYWAKVKLKGEEGRQRHAEWVGRQKEGLERLRYARERTSGALERVRANQQSNYEKLASARTAEHRERIQGWIDEGEEKIRDMERSIQDIDEKIRDAEDKLDE